MTRYLQRQIAEIAESSVLQLYGFALTLIHALTLMQLGRTNFTSLFANFENPVCWPFFSSCGSLGWSPAVLQTALGVYGALILATFICLSVRRMGAAYGLSALLLLVKFALMSLSYQFMVHDHDLAQILQLLWLFAPHKVEILRLMLVAATVASGLFKLNLDWLSGAALSRVPSVDSRALTAALAYTPVVEVVLAFGLLVQRRWVQILALIQVVGVQVLWSPYLDDSSPLVMATLLSFFVFLLLERQPETRASLDSILGGRLAKSSMVLLALFALLQFLPASLPLASFSRLEGVRECSAVLQYRDENGHGAQAAPFRTNYLPRIACDPLVFLDETRRQCAQAPIKEARLILFSKRSTDRDYKKILDVQNVCERKNLLWTAVIP